jgi:hypothetical protein
MPRRASPARKELCPSAPKKSTAKQTVLELVKKHRQKLAIGAACYKAADELLTQIMAKSKAGKRVRMGDGLYAVVVDLFEAQDKYFKPIAVKRYELQIQDATGKAVRMRDRGRKKPT